MKLCNTFLFFVLLALSRVKCIKVISNNDVYLEDETEKTVDDDYSSPTGVGYIHNVSLTSESTICFKIKTYQFYQFYKSEFDPSQAIFSIKNIFTLVTYPTIPCDEFYYGCTSATRAKLGNLWKHGKTFYELLGSPNHYPSWAPNTWNSICIVIKSDKIILYVNDALIEELHNTFTDTIFNFR